MLCLPLAHVLLVTTTVWASVRAAPAAGGAMVVPAQPTILNVDASEWCNVPVPHLQPTRAPCTQCNNKRHNTLSNQLCNSQLCNSQKCNSRPLVSAATA
jgi:hypothetical protein